MIVLDTHAWVWWAADPRKLSDAARRAIDEARDIGISAISCWEVAMLAAQGRIEFDRDLLLWIRQALALPRLSLLPLSPEIAVASAQLGHDFVGDPADRIIVATALQHKARLVTKDRRLRTSRRIETTW